MKEYPILFSGPMVRAILEGRKTQTRRIRGLEQINKNPNIWTFTGFKSDLGYPASRGLWAGFTTAESNTDVYIKSPYGSPGGRLWVRETWRETGSGQRADGNIPTYKVPVIYAADVLYNDGSYRPSIHMPRWASRITLEIVSVRVERLQEITREGVVSEGIGFHISNLGARNSSPTRLYEAFPDREGGYTNAKEAFGALWDSINRKKYPWESNPWVWVIEFIHKVRPPDVGASTATAQHGGTI